MSTSDSFMTAHLPRRDDGVTRSVPANLLDTSQGGQVSLSYPRGSMDSVLDKFGSVTRAWFQAAFAAPTPAQTGAWGAIGAGRHALVVAPTGSGKTLAAFLWSSPSCSTRLDCTGSRITSCGPITDVEGLRNSSGSLGTSAPCSAACST